MASIPKTGFGSLPPTVLTIGDVLTTFINAAADVAIGITHLSFSAFQTSGTPAASGELFIPYYVMRGSTGGSPAIPGAGTYFIQIPTFKQIADSGYELLVADFISVSNNGVPITFERGHLEAKGNQQLVVISGAPFDATTLIPVNLASVSTQTVLGYDASSVIHRKLR